MKLLQPVQLAEFQSIIYQGRMCLNVALKRNLAEPSHCEKNKQNTHAPAPLAAKDGQIPPAVRIYSVKICKRSRKRAGHAHVPASPLKIYSV